MAQKKYLVEQFLAKSLVLCQIEIWHYACLICYAVRLGKVLTIRHMDNKGKRMHPNYDIRASPITQGETPVYEEYVMREATQKVFHQQWAFSIKRLPILVTDKTQEIFDFTTRTFQT